MTVVRSPVRSVVRSPVRGVFGGSASLIDDATSYLAGITPYHWFDFVNDRCLYASNDVGGVSGATGYSFARASQGYYTNADGTLTLFGHNLLLRSQEFDNAAWITTVSGTGLAATVTANAGVAPDGTTTADRVQISLNGGTTSSDISTLSQTFAGYTSGIPYTFTVWLKSNTGVDQTVLLLNFNSQSSAVTVTAEWQRFTWLVTPGSTISSGAGIRLRGSFANGPADLLVWGAQLEVGSQATSYVPTTSAAASALRRGNRGVLIEGARTNLLTRSQEFDDAAWTRTNATVTANQTAAPDGTTTADQMFETAVTGDHTLNLSATVVTATTYTITVFAKKGTTSRDHLVIGTVGAGTGFSYFNLTTGAVGTKLPAHTSSRITALANGWYRCEIVVLTTTTSLNVFIGSASTDGSSSYAGNTSFSVFLWGAQLEAASFPSSYIPTTTASATRAADVLTCTAGVSYPLSLWAEFERAVDTGGDEYLLQAIENTSNRAPLVMAGATDLIQAYVVTAGAVVASPTVAGSVAVGVATKAAMRVETDNVRPVRGGTLGTLDNVAALPSAISTLQIGHHSNAAQPFGYIRRAAIFNSALSDANLQSVTG